MIFTDITDNIRIYNADAKEIVYNDMIDKVDCVVTDPPYPLTSGGKNTGTMGGILSKENYNNNGKIVDCSITWDEIADICFKSLKEDTHCYMMANNRNVKDMWMAAENSGFYFHNLLVWVKGNTVANKYYMKNCEFTGFFKKGKAKTINLRGSQSAVKVANNKETKHPNEKPVELMKLYILNSTQENDLVLDPFCGSGSVAMACIETNRRFIGIEKDKQHYEECVERLKRYVDRFG